MTTASNSIPPLDNDTALDRLRDAGEVETTITALAKTWGWDRSRASRTLDRWERAGLITRRSGSDRQTVFFARPAIPPMDASTPAVSAVAQQTDGTFDIPVGPAVPLMHASIPVARRSEGTVAISAGPAPLAVHASNPPAHAVAPTGAIPGGSAALSVQATGTTMHVAPQLKMGRDWSLTVHFTFMLVAALGLAIVGGVMNARFAASFGRSNEAALLLATIGVLIDLLVTILPTVGSCIWRAGRRASGVAAWCLWLFVGGMSLLASAGFGATNIGDAIAGRDRTVHEVAGVRTTVDRLRAERATSTESRSTAVLQAQLESARAPLDRDVWKATKGCHDITTPNSAAACAAVLTIRQAMAAATRRDAVEAELRAAEEKLASLPAIQAVEDPQAEVAAGIVDFITFGRLAPEPQDIARIRIIGLALMPTLSGIVLALGMALRREADQRATLERAFAIQQRGLPYGTMPQKSVQRSVSVRNRSRGAVDAAGGAQLDLPFGNVDGKAA